MSIVLIILSTVVWMLLTSGNTSFVCLALIPLSVLISLVTAVIDTTNLRYKIISINRNSTIRIGFSRDRSKPTRWTDPSSVNKINLLVYNAGYTFDNYVNDQGTLVKVNNAITTYPRLFMYAGSIEYEVGHRNRISHNLQLRYLSQGELLWLGQEISDFLGIEMKVIYPTPKVPPESVNA